MQRDGQSYHYTTPTNHTPTSMDRLMCSYFMHYLLLNPTPLLQLSQQFLGKSRKLNCKLPATGPM